MSRRWLLILLLSVCITVAAASALAWSLTMAAGERRVAARLADRLTVTGHAVASEIDRFRYLPRVLAQDPRVVALVETGAGPADRVSRYLTRVRDDAGADEVFVLDRTGTTLAASNWSEETSFVGRNYRFRPYFKKALEAGEGRFYGIGVTTGKPGYFLSSAIDTPSGVGGVAVVKVDMSEIERIWGRAGEKTGVADAAGVVFLTGHGPWKYRVLDPLTPAGLAAIGEAKKYEGVRLLTDRPLAVPADGGDRPETADSEGERLLLLRRTLVPEGWQLFATASLAPVRLDARLAALLTACGALLATAVVAFLRQRRQIGRMTRDAHAALERRVAERTEALEHEIEDRRRAEEGLRAAQENLIQAAKLAALGRMSTAIAHEVSQPLAAMETTLASTALLAERGTAQDVKAKVATARELVRRMQRTVHHLKSFARKDRGGLAPVTVARVVASAVELAAHRARAETVSLSVSVPSDLPAALGHAVRLEQVVLNLLLNALDAVRGQPAPMVAVAASGTGGAVEITVTDNGAGIDDDVRERITEPFFTTKETGEGLGLGLAISRAIVEDFGGSLVFAARTDGGSVFTVTLRTAPREATVA